MVGELNEKQHEYLNHILQGIEQMSALINDLLNLRRIEAGVGIRHEPCHIGLILVEAVDSMRARATAKGIGLRLEPELLAIARCCGKPSATWWIMPSNIPRWVGMCAWG